jgi:aspartate aminotransferase
VSLTAVSLVAERHRGLESSPTLALAAKAKALRQAGKAVVDLTAGEPDFPTPAAVKRAAIAALEKNLTRYTPVPGIPELRQAVATTIGRRLGVAYEPSQVIVSCGAKHSLYNALQILCEPGDEVIIFTPFWVSYVPLVQLAVGTPVLVEGREEDRFQPDLEELAKRLSPRTKAIILNSPSNPTGMLIGRDRLAGIARVALDRGLIVISDEIYDELVYPPAQAASILHVEPRLAGQTVIVNGVSKTYAMTGWRIGYALGPAPLMKAIDAFQSHSTSNPTSISQYAALEALTGDQSEVRRMAEEFQQRRDRLVDGLNRLPGLSCVKPEGAFYAWCNVSRLGQPAATIASRWLEEALIAAIPGEGFGSAAHIRFSFATSVDVIDEALARLAKWLPSARSS